MNFKTVPWMALLTLVGLIVIPALFADVIAPHDPYRGDLTRVLEPPIWDGGTWEYPFGTDRVGRDVLTRVIYGGRVSLLIAAAGIGTGLVIGTVLGLAAGYYRGIVDAVIMRFADLLAVIAHDPDCFDSCLVAGSIIRRLNRRTCLRIMGTVCAPSACGDSRYPRDGLRCPRSRSWDARPVDNCKARPAERL